MAGSPWANNGGKRRHHIPPTLSPAQVAEAQVLYAAGTPYKTMERIFKVSRYTLSRAIVKTRPKV